MLLCLKILSHLNSRENSLYSRCTFSSPNNIGLLEVMVAISMSSQVIILKHGRRWGGGGQPVAYSEGGGDRGVERDVSRGGVSFYMGFYKKVIITLISQDPLYVI